MKSVSPSPTFLRASVPPAALVAALVACSGSSPSSASAPSLDGGDGRVDDASTGRSKEGDAATSTSGPGDARREDGQDGKQDGGHGSGDGGGVVVRGDGGGRDDSGKDGSGEDAPTAASSFVLGWYEQASCTCNSNYGGPGNIDTFASWLGAPITIGSDYEAEDSGDAGAAWDNWAFPGWQSTGWKKWRVAHPDNRLVIAPGFGIEHDLAGGAAGNYDAYWKQLGESLIAAGYPDAIIRIAHEFNGYWYWYEPQGVEAEFIGYWQHAVSAMRSATGQRFEFFWNPSLGVSYESGTPFDCEKAYPGDAYVDYIGPDTYDTDSAVYPTSGTITQSMQDHAWQDILTQDHGLNWFVTFAAQHHKPLAIAEWGLWTVGSGNGGGDDPSYIENMHEWVIANHLAFANYFDAMTNVIYPGDTFPSSLAKFKSLF